MTADAFYEGIGFLRPAANGQSARGVHKHDFSADSTFNTWLANACVLLFKMFPRSHANF